MRDELEQVTLSQRKRVGNVVYKYLLDDLEAAGLGRNFKKLESVPSAPLQVYINSRPGYYGAKGSSIIESVLVQIIDLKTTPIHSFWPLSLSRFTRYFLVPFVACTLISEDLKCSLEEAYEEIIASGNAGQNIHLYEENDKQLDKISRAEFGTKMKEHTEIISMRRKELKDIAKECFLEEATK
ncbi:hypothetical protein SERLADRAFT_433020 [Serpula lacrymans var. lacrymans S7.9]|uniref:Restriction of telomere capping protein 4 C-terminal domain-containing protein n=1 Tax=Serpula lacrymans var. lacrymans (strain S7.9) TaxID=578457 RepID=F8NIX2_SERL9|nr:uncharacterized protein SERLADRAFT_433020 [Serpula lacrymans var. lacrymans S7.9]EGO29005.1 hypothetical protein SERLADRAFT_433020 [Serpula lacrymans var. lacrymans S7.9]